MEPTKRTRKRHVWTAAAAGVVLGAVVVACGGLAFSISRAMAKNAPIEGIRIAVDPGAAPDKTRVKRSSETFLYGNLRKRGYRDNEHSLQLNLRYVKIGESRFQADGETETTDLVQLQLDIRDDRGKLLTHIHRDIPAPKFVKVNASNSANHRVYINAMFELKEFQLPAPDELYRGQQQ